MKPARSDTASDTATIAGPMESPMVIAASRMLLRATCILAAVVSARLANSSCAAEPAAHAFCPSSRDVESKSPAPAILSSAEVTRTSDWPNSSRTVKTSPPEALIRPRPWVKALTACAGRSSNARANSWVVMPATSANRTRSSLPVLTALLMSMRTDENAVPPASASMPTDARALDTASKSGSDRPTTLAAPAIRDAMATMSRSVDAPLLPRCTRAAAKRSTPSVPRRSMVPMTLLIWAMDVAASSALRLVVSPSLIIVVVKPTMSLDLTPSCPAASATAAISSWVAGRVFASPRSAASI